MSQFDDLFKTLINENFHLYQTIKTFFKDVLPKSQTPDIDAAKVLANLKKENHPIVMQVMQMYPTNKPIHILRFIQNRLFPSSAVTEGYGGYQTFRHNPFADLNPEQKKEEISKIAIDPATKTFIDSQPMIKSAVDNVPTLSGFMLDILETVLRTKRVSPKQLEIFQREHNKINKVGTGDFFGKIGDRQQFDVEFVERKEGRYKDGTSWAKSIMKMPDGTIIMYKAFGMKPLQLRWGGGTYGGGIPGDIKLKPEYTEFTDQVNPLPGDNISFNATIKDYVIEDGKKVTVVARPSRADMSSGTQSIHANEPDI